MDDPNTTDETPAPAQSGTMVAQVTECIPSLSGHISALASASAPFIYFDGTSYYAYGNGVGCATLTALRQIANCTTGTVLEDRVVVALLRASLPALLTLRDAINDIENMAKRDVPPPSTSAPPAMPPSGLAH